MTRQGVCSMTSHVWKCVRTHTEHQNGNSSCSIVGEMCRVHVSTCLSSGRKSLAAMMSLLSCWMTRSQLMPVWLAYRARAQRRSLQAELTTRCKPMSSTSPNVCACSSTSMCHQAVVVCTTLAACPLITVLEFAVHREVAPGHADVTFTCLPHA